MAVVEIGTWNVRAGYVGDITCTRSFRAMQCKAFPEVVDFMAMLQTASLSKEGSAESCQPVYVQDRADASLGADGYSCTESDLPSLSPLWNLRGLEDDMDAHVRYLSHVKRKILGCSEGDPLMLVVPELWHERLDLMQALVGLVLEEPGLTQAVYCCRPSVGWAFSAGRASAVVVDVGHSHSTAVAVLDGYALRHTLLNSFVGGAAVTSQLEPHVMNALTPSLTKCYRHITNADARRCLLEDMICDVKHHYGVVAARDGPLVSPPKEETRATLQAPDGTPLTLKTDDCAGAFEVLFGCQQDHFNVAEMTVKCKNKLNPEWQLQTVQHVLAGAGSMVRGFRDRLLSEAKELDSTYFRYERDGAMHVVKAVDGAWSGASLSASSSSFVPLWISRQEWEEEGVSVMHRKFFY